MTTSNMITFNRADSDRFAQWFGCQSAASLPYTIIDANRWMQVGAGKLLRDRVAACARGTYQSDLLDGKQAWSGATLRGKAREYGASYQESRGSLLRRLRDAGLSLQWVSVQPGGRHILVVMERGAVLRLRSSVDEQARRQAARQNSN